MPGVRGHVQKTMRIVAWFSLKAEADRAIRLHAVLPPKIFLNTTLDWCSHSSLHRHSALQTRYKMILRLCSSVG